jgi:hypothetical protein
MQMLPMLMRRLLQQLPTLNQIWRLWLVSQQATACTALTAAFVSPLRVLLQSSCAVLAPWDGTARMMSNNLSSPQ